MTSLIAGRKFIVLLFGRSNALMMGVALVFVVARNLLDLTATLISMKYLTWRQNGHCEL